MSQPLLVVLAAPSPIIHREQSISYASGDWRGRHRDPTCSYSAGLLFLAVPWCNKYWTSYRGLALGKLIKIMVLLTSLPDSVQNWTVIYGYGMFPPILNLLKDHWMNWSLSEVSLTKKINFGVSNGPTTTECKTFSLSETSNTTNSIRKKHWVIPSEMRVLVLFLIKKL